MNRATVHYVIAFAMIHLLCFAGSWLSAGQLQVGLAPLGATVWAGCPRIYAPARCLKSLLVARECMLRRAELLLSQTRGQQ